MCYFILVRFNEFFGVILIPVGMLNGIMDQDVESLETLTASRSLPSRSSLGSEQGILTEHCNKKTNSRSRYSLGIALVCLVMGLLLFLFIWIYRNQTVEGDTYIIYEF